MIHSFIFRNQPKHRRAHIYRNTLSHTLLAILQSPINLYLMILDCGRKPIPTRGEHANYTQKDFTANPRTELGPSHCEMTALITAPPYNHRFNIEMLYVLYPCLSPGLDYRIVLSSNHMTWQSQCHNF